MLGKYNQHSADVLDLSLSPMAFMKRSFPPADGKKQQTDDWWIAYLQLCARAPLSDLQ